MKNGNDFFDGEQMKTITGVLAFITILHQVSVSQTGVDLFGNYFIPLKYVGVLCVGYFMFMLGYKAVYEYANNGMKIGREFFSKIYSLLITFFICNYAYMIVTQIMGVHYSSRELLAAFFGIMLLNNQMWFAVEILFLYLLFAAVFALKIKNVKTKFIIYILVCLGFMTFSLLLGHTDVYGISNWLYGEWWYNTTACFWLGMLFGFNKEKCSVWIKNNYKKILTISLVFLVIMFGVTVHIIDTRGYWSEDHYSMHYDDKIISYFVQTVTEILFVTFIVTVGEIYKFKNKIAIMSGSIYMELILINNIFIFICSKLNFAMNLYVYVISEIIFTYVAAFILYKIRCLAVGNKEV